ncbi:hypothetical protein ACHAPE_000489 [Trichoderma viride]
MWPPALCRVQVPSTVEIFAFGPWPVSVALIAQNPSPSPQERRHRPSSGQGLGENPAMAASIRGIPAVQPISTQRGNPSGNSSGLQRAPASLSALRSQSRQRCRSTGNYEIDPTSIALELSLSRRLAKAPFPASG